MVSRFTPMPFKLFITIELTQSTIPFVFVNSRSATVMLRDFATACPQNWGLFSSIKDKNSLENIGGWTYKTYSNTHYIWQSNNTSSGSNINLTFKY